MRIRVKPLTTMANACVWFGSYEQVTVGPDTTFYITDELDKSFAYTPSRSPIRRLAPVQTIEIRWPLEDSGEEAAQEGEPEAGGEESAGQGDAAGKDPGSSVDRKDEKEPPEPADQDNG